MTLICWDLLRLIVNMSTVLELQGVLKSSCNSEMLNNSHSNILALSGVLITM